MSSIFGSENHKLIALNLGIVGGRANPNSLMCRLNTNVNRIKLQNQLLTDPVLHSLFPSLSFLY